MGVPKRDGHPLQRWIDKVLESCRRVAREEFAIVCSSVGQSDALNAALLNDVSRLTRNEARETVFKVQLTCTAGMPVSGEKVCW